MRNLKSYEIRQIWMDFWKAKGHEIIPSAPLVPRNDPTLLWINAGIAPLKKYFDGREIPSNRRLANVQKSLRTNDIENVGKTSRHHTFFEMLGNFSIGDYFRDEALEYGFEILTSSKYFGFDLDKLYFTVYPTDFETVEKWMSLGVPRDHIVNVEGNFWEIGDGPCGPNTEIFFDRGVKYDPNNIGVKLIEEDIENDRYIEFWNIVLSQYNAKAGLKRSQYPELPKKNIDTGMGLERIACILQEVESNYETDLFVPIINEISSITGVNYTGQMGFKVIADHLRSVVFALSDGAMFSNEGRGYVLRRLLRRAIRYGRMLGMKEAFLYKLVNVVIEIMKPFYDYLLEKAEIVIKQIRIEEEKFLVTLESGEKRLLDYIANAESKVVNAKIAFLLYDTFGFPIELTNEVASEQGFNVDEAGFEELLKNQKQTARNARTNDQSMNTQNESMMNFKEKSVFVGYEEIITISKVVGLFKDGTMVTNANGIVIAVFDKTGFYAESGGQTGDIGLLTKNNMNYAVTNTIKLPNGQHGLVVDVKDDELVIDEIVSLAVDEDFRHDVEKNHSATHLLNEALRQIVGPHIVQQGSQVYNYGLRFDFNNFEPLTNEQIIAIEDLVNEVISRAIPVNISQMPIDEAKSLGVQALFGEKYGDIVRVVNMDFSKELCGGTHVKNTSDIEKFAIISIETKGSGIYRIEAATGSHILPELETSLENNLERIYNIGQEAKTNNIELDKISFNQTEAIESYQMVINRRNEVEVVREQFKQLEKTLTRKLREMNQVDINDFLLLVNNINGKNVLLTRVEMNLNAGKDLVDRLSDSLDESIVFIAIVNEDKLIFICKNKIKGLKAGQLVKLAANITLGNGGGRDDFAQAGGKDITKLDEAFVAVRKAIEEAI